MKIVFCSPEDQLIDKWNQTFGSTVDFFWIDSIAALTRHLATETPDLLILHLDNTERNLDAAVSLILENERLRVFVVHESPNNEDGLVLLKAGVCGYVNVGIDPRLMQLAVQKVSRGGIWVSRILMQRLVEDLTGGGVSDSVDNPSLYALTPREYEVAKIAATGAKNLSIADQLGVTERTVKAHLTSAFQKTNTRNRSELSRLILGQMYPSPAIGEG